jgi:hypothetical protein
MALDINVARIANLSTGILIDDFKSVLGRKVKRKISEGEIISEGDIS